MLIPTETMPCNKISLPQSNWEKYQGPYKIEIGRTKDFGWFGCIVSLDRFTYFQHNDIIAKYAGEDGFWELEDLIRTIYRHNEGNTINIAYIQDGP